MWRFRKKECKAKIIYDVNISGIVETRLSCRKCPEAKLNNRIGRQTTKAAMRESKILAANEINQHSSALRILRAMDANIKADNAFHYRLP
jgi:hypothetical protein